MGMIEVEVNDKGEVGKLPDVLQKLFEDKFKEAYGKGATKAAEEAKAHSETAIAKAREEERAKGGESASEKERLKTLESELSRRKEAEHVAKADYEKASKEREERYAKDQEEIAKKTAEERQALSDKITMRETRIRELIATDIKIEAQRNSAREDSLRLISKDLNDFVEMGDDLLPVVNVAKFVKEFSQSRLGQDGKPVAIEGLVQEYLSLHPLLKSPVKGVGGRAAGGQSLSGQQTLTGVDAEKAEALTLVATNPSVTNIAAAMSRAGKTARVGA